MCTKKGQRFSITERAAVFKHSFEGVELLKSFDERKFLWNTIQEKQKFRYKGDIF